jgi:hypothetical protein
MPSLFLPAIVVVVAVLDQPLAVNFMVYVLLSPKTCFLSENPHQRPVEIISEKDVPNTVAGCRKWGMFLLFSSHPNAREKLKAGTTRQMPSRNYFSHQALHSAVQC